MEKEVVVIGCGPAGLSAALYLGRGNVKTLLIGKTKESQVMKAYKIYNYLGFPNGIKGRDFMKKSLAQVKKYKVPIIEREVIDVERKGNFFLVKLDNKKIIKTKALIISTGTPIRLSGVENEERLTNKGVHYCVECDGALYQNKKLAVIGNGNHAAEQALSILRYTKDITIISNANNFEFSSKLETEIKNKKIKLLNENVKSFIGKNKLENILLMNGKMLKFDAAYMGCGEFSALDFSSKLALKIENDSLVIDQNGMTCEEGVFAAGNCVSKCRQIAKSVGDGCNAALSAIRFVRHKELYQDYGVKRVC